MPRPILEASDLHLNPGERLFPAARAFFLKAQHDGCDIVLNGDVLNLLPWGRQAWHTPEARETIEDLRMALPPGGAEVIAGNHDPYQWLSPLLATYPQFRVHREWTQNGWHFVHGHQRSDWVVLRLVAPGLVEWLVQHAPGPWYRVCRAMGWLPGELKRAAGGQETQRYTMLTAAIHGAWQKHAERGGHNLCIGHTHVALHATWYRGRLPGHMVDGGDLRDGQAVLLTGDQVSLVWVQEAASTA